MSEGSRSLVASVKDRIVSTVTGTIAGVKVVLREPFRSKEEK